MDHVAGSRRGQRQEFPGGTRVRFGRHPECEVAFDPHRDIDASSRHAELRIEDNAYRLADLGSTNGTFVDGLRTTEATIAPNTAITVEFGPGGPALRLIIGDTATIDALPALRPPRGKRWVWPSVMAIACIVGAGLWLALR